MEEAADESVIDSDKLRMRAENCARYFLEGYLTETELISKLAENPLEVVPVIDELPDLQKKVDELRQHIHDGKTIIVGSYC